LAHSDLVETLLELHRRQCSCVVRLSQGNAKKQLVVIQGVLAYAESNQPQEHLAHVLHKLNLLSPNDLKNVAGWMKKGKNSCEAVVLATGLEEKSLADGVREQAEMILASLFSWPDCEIRLFNGESLSLQRCLVSLPLPQAIVEAARRAVRDRLVPSACRELAGRLCPASAAGARTELPLSSAEAFAYTLADGSTPTAQLLALIPSGEDKPEHLIQRLFILGLLTPAGAEREGAASARTQNALSDRIDELLQHFEVANLYEILSVPPDADAEKIKAAYHDLARLYHPDRFEAREFSDDMRARAERLFTYITGAYATLSDPVVRASYDDTRLAKESQVEAALHGRASGDADKEKMAETIFRSGMRLLKNKDFEKAVPQLRECVWLRPGNARYHHFLGVAQAEIAALLKEAEQHFLKAIELEHTNSDTYLQLGKLYLKVNLPKRAELQLYEVLRWDSENAEATRLLASLAGKSAH
jgi:curved DNA-binding protein CbpA